MTMSADSREAWQPSWSCDSLNERLRRTSCPQQHYLPTTRIRRTVMSSSWRQSSRFGTLGYLLIFIASLWIIPASAVFIDFQNCLSQGYQNDEPLQLQFDPLYMDAVFNTTDPSHNLRITIWGNVTGSGPTNQVVLPPANDTAYWNSNQTNLGGKIEEIPDPDLAQPKDTTLFGKINVLTYEPWNEAVNFCTGLINATCPLGPSFTANA
jgi:hypothetical protein